MHALTWIYVLCQSFGLLNYYGPVDESGDSGAIHLVLGKTASM
jgi:hypothetical protein